MKKSPHNPAATYWQDTFEAAVHRHLHSTDIPVCRQASIDWLHGRRRWLPITRGEYDYWLNVLPAQSFHDGILLSSEESADGLHHAFRQRIDDTFWLTLLSPAEARSRFDLDIPFATDLPVFTRESTPAIPLRPLGPHWHIPKTLTRAGRKAAEAIRDFCIERDLTHTGCRVFYSPEEWRARGEAHATSSLLVVVYDGAAVRRALSFDAEDYDTLEALRLILDPLDVFSEECTCWYSGIYNA